MKNRSLLSIAVTAALVLSSATPAFAGPRGGPGGPGPGPGTPCLPGEPCNEPPAVELTITEKAMVSEDTAVSNQKSTTEVPLAFMRFDAKAKNGNARLTKVIFNAAEGNVLNAQNYSLWVDTDNNGSVDSTILSGINASMGTVVFDGINYTILKDATVLFEVRADIAPILMTPKVLKLKFATTVADYVAGENATTGAPLVGISTNGSCNSSSCKIFVNTNNGATRWILRDQGTLFVTSGLTRSRQLLGGTLADDILKLDFRAEYEPIDVTFLVFTATEANAASFANDVDRLELYAVGDTTPFATATVSACGTDPVPANSMCASMTSKNLLVAKGTTKSILVRPKMRTDENNAVSGHLIGIRIDKDGGTNWDSVRARGDWSTNNLLKNNNDLVDDGEIFKGRSTIGANIEIRGKKNAVVLSKISSITNANPNADGTAIPTGTSAFGQFKFTAFTNSNTKNGLNKSTLSAAIFNVTATNVQMSNSFKLYNKFDETTKASCRALTTAGVLITTPTVTGDFLVECRALTSTAVNFTLDSGASYTYVLEGSVTNPKVSSTVASVLQASFGSFGDIESGYGFASNHVQWLDQDTATTKFSWIELLETIIKSTKFEG